MPERGQRTRSGCIRRCKKENAADFVRRSSAPNSIAAVSRNDQSLGERPVSRRQIDLSASEA